MTEFDRHGIVYTTARAVKNSKKDRIKKLLTKRRQHDILSKLLLSNTKSETETLRKKLFKKVLDKIKQLWYNERVADENRQQTEP